MSRDPEPPRRLEEALRDAADLLRVKRSERGISKRQVADMAGVAPSQLTRIEGGRDALLSTRLRLFDALGYRARLVVGGQNDDVSDYLVEEQDRRWLQQEEGRTHGKARGQRW